jgi:tetratricopeptide (TPR) repeat protein
MSDELDVELLKDTLQRRRLQGTEKRTDSRIAYRHNADIESLITICSNKLKSDPQHPKALFLRASSLLKKGQLLEAISDCEALLAADPRHVGAYYIRGCAYDKMGDIDRGITDYTEVLRLDPNHVNAAYARGACQNRKGNFAQAIEDYSMALAKDQERLDSPSKRQDDRLQPLPQKDEDLPITIERRLPFNSALSLDVKLSETPSYFPTPRGSERPAVEMSTSLASSQRMEPGSLKQSADWLHTQGYNARKQGDLNTAIYYYTEALKVNPSHFKALFNRAFAYDKLGQFDTAIEDYSRALSTDPNNAFAYYNRGISYDRKGDYGSAIADFSTAIQLDPTKPDFYHNRGFAYQRLASAA